MGCAFADEEEAEPVRLGIMRFTSKTYDVPDGMAEVIGDFFGRMLFKSDGIQLLERERLEDVGSEINLGMSGLVNDKTAAKVGKLAGCQYVLLGSITNLARGASGMAVPLFVIPVGIGNAKQKVKATLDVRVIDVETATVVFAESAEGEASKSDNITTFYGISFEDSEFGGIENVAIAQAAAKLSPKIEEALTGKDTLSEILNPQPQKAKKSTSDQTSTKYTKSKSRSKKKAEQEKKPTELISASEVSTSGNATKTEPENQSTDPAKVIKSYGLPSGEANTLRVKHINAAKLKNSKKAYDAYVKLAEENTDDYLAAFKAGEIANKLKKSEEAKEWFTKALKVNPYYVPARKALEKLH
jgi:curli biogenesis system outer membrane secretion channel CsgG